MGLTYKFVPPGTQLQGQGGELPSGIVFQSSWPNVTGTSDAAIRQTDRPTPWTTLASSGQNNWSISPATGGVTFTNMARSLSRTAGGTWNELALNNGWSQVAVGESLAVRMYRRFSASYASYDPETHGDYHILDVDADGWQEEGQIGLYDYHNSGTNHIPLISIISDGLYVYFWQPGTSGSIDSIDITLGNWYRYEWLYTRTGTNTFTVKYRVYTLDGTELINESQMDGTWWAAGQITTLANTTFTSVSSQGGSTRQRGLLLGVNGLDSPPTTGTPLTDYGGVLVRKGTNLSFPTGQFSSLENTWTP